MKKKLIILLALIISFMLLDRPVSAGFLRDLIIQRMKDKMQNGGGQGLGGSDQSLPQGTTEVDLEYGGKSRYYLIHVPPSYDKNKLGPVVFVIHGGGGNGLQIEKKEAFDPFSDRDGILVVYPSGSSKMFKDKLLTWNTQLTTTYADKEKIDDLGFLLKVLEDVSSKYAVDPKRVFSTGMSQGGFMSYRLACEASDKIAAIAPVSGGLVVDNCHPTSQVSVLAFNGMKDTRVRYEGGTGSAHVLSISSVADVMNLWVQKDGLSNQTPTQQVIGNAELKLYGPNPQGTEVGVWTLKDAGHAWPGKTGERQQADKPNMDIDATALIWEFFKKHSKP